MNIEEYDEIVVKIQRLYEEMYSVISRRSENLGQNWEIHLTLGGVITHGIPALRLLFRDEAREIVFLYLVEIYFGGNPTLFLEARNLFKADYYSVNSKIDEFINATFNGRTINLETLKDYLRKLKRIRNKGAYKPFFLYKSFREYYNQAVGHFNQKGEDLYMVSVRAVEMRIV